MPRTYYETPTQVKFYDSIADELCFVDIQGVLNDGAEDGIAVPILELPWVDISDEIKGE